MCSKSNPLVVFALDLMSTYEGEHTIFGLLGQANLTQNDVLQCTLLNLDEFGQMCTCVTTTITSWRPFLCSQNFLFSVPLTLAQSSLDLHANGSDRIYSFMSVFV
jgi:hypothetical protein